MNRVMQSEYMPWAKLQSHAKHNLATSGVMSFPLSGLPVSLHDLEICGPSYYGYAPLQAAMARHCGVPEENIVAATGCSGANFLAMSALLEPGDEVLIEAPTYELMPAALRYLGAELREFARRPENGYAVDVDEVGRLMTPRTRLIVLTNLHNPSSTLLDEATLRQVGDLAADAGIHVLVDEVYLDAMFEQSPKSSFFLGPQFVVTSSLTKIYGLSGLRCGWILTQPDLAHRMWRLNDLMGVIPAHPAERLSVIAFANLDHIRQRTRALLDIQQPILNEFLAGRDDLDCPPLHHGTVVFPRWKGGTDAGPLCDHLRERYQTTVVPGRFFGMSAHFRIGIGGETDNLKSGLHHLGSALDDLRSR